MDILTLGKMNAMARDVDVTLEYLANSTFQALKDVCDFQAGNMLAIETATAEALASIGSSNAFATTTKSLYVGCNRFNGSTGQESINYGGWSCGWSVPDGVQSIKFEIYGAGASGDGGCCCMMNPLPGGAGAYAVKHLNKPDGDFVTGDTYSICAGGTGCCWSGSHGNKGHTSYVTGPSLTNFCAVGGHQGEHHCQNWNCYTCCQTCYGCAQIYGADYGVSGNSSWRKSSFAGAWDMYQVAAHPGGPLGKGGMSLSSDSCVTGFHSGGGPATPGTGAFGAATSWPCCCGNSGGGGGVLITYWG